MRLSKNFSTRMQQRGISKVMADLVLIYGRYEQDKLVLDRREIDRRLGELDQERKVLLKARDKGGVVVVANDNTLITTYNCNERGTS